MIELPPHVEPWPWQRRWLEDNARFKIGMWSRQTGKTWTATLEIVLDVLAARRAGRASSWLILSRGERQAREAMRAGVHVHARALAGGGGEDAFAFRAHEWDAGDGNVVTALPANPDTARGYSRHVYLDEFALHPDSRGIWAALYPTVTRGGRLRITSTPKGRRGKFHELMAGRGAGGASSWSRHTVDIHKAVAEGYPVDAGELRAGLADDAIWRQEYECRWLDESLSWLSWETILAAEDAAAGKPAGYAGGPVFIGVDIARRNDLWVAWAIEMVGDVAWTREIRTLRNAPFAAQDAALDAMRGRYRAVRIAADRTGIGEMPVEGMKARYGADRVEGVAFTAPRKLDLATALRERLETRRLRIPPDPALRADLHGVTRMVGLTGAMRLVPDGEGGAHADRFWAGALACAAAAAPPLRAAAAPAAAPAQVRAAFAPRRR